jgi:ABC-type polysaccharide/polyol phosphate export permease
VTATLPGRHFARNLIERRTLLLEMVKRDFKQRFAGSAAGWLWGVIHPLVLLASWTFVFQVCLKTPTQSHLTDNYTIFLFCGFLPWLLFQETVQRSAAALLEHSNLITKTLFPSEVVPVSIFLSALINHVIAIGLVSIAVIVWDRGISPMMLFLPVYILLNGLFAIGLGWIISSLNVYLRDTAQVVQVVLTLWFWLTPIFITREMVPDKLRFLVDWNPLSYIVNAYRELILNVELPNWREMAIVAAFAITVFVAGGLFFRHLKRGFADVL